MTVVAALGEHGGFAVERGGGSVLGVFASPERRGRGGGRPRSTARRAAAACASRCTRARRAALRPPQASTRRGVGLVVAAEGQVLLAATTAALVTARPRRRAAAGDARQPRAAGARPDRDCCSSCGSGSRRRRCTRASGRSSSATASSRRSSRWRSAARARRRVARRDRGDRRHRQDAPARRGARRRSATSSACSRRAAGELEGDFAFGVVRQLFESLLATAPAERRAELSRRRAALAEPLFDATHLDTRAELEGNAVRDDARPLLARGQPRLEQPTMLAIDDLHWADTPSLRWLCYLARRLEGLPLLVAVTTRPPEQGRDPSCSPSCSATRRRRRSVRARSRRLDRRAHAAAVRRGRRRRVLRRGRGGDARQPAARARAARHGRARGRAPQADQAHVLLELGPLVVGRAVSLRLARLPGRGDRADRGGGDPRRRHQPRPGGRARGARAGAGAAKAARILLRSDLLIRDDPVEFFHPVVRTAIYDGLDTLARSEGHRRAADVLVEAGALPEQAAAHLLLATAAPTRSWSTTLREAAAPLARARAPPRRPSATSSARSRRSATTRRGPRCSSSSASPSG